jgi:hypothetical protein
LIDHESGILYEPRRGGEGLPPKMLSSQRPHDCHRAAYLRDTRMRMPEHAANQARTNETTDSNDGW